ncbi:MAG: hypothetical protein K0U52_09640 [Gammaproteobacteria bacterium]|nr:hypothetical protein [Gammaproteobacteria bacterium]
MELPIPKMDSGSQVKDMNILKKTVDKIDMVKFGNEVLMNLKRPLVESDFKNLSQKWIVVIDNTGPHKYLMFVNNTPSEMSKNDVGRIMLKLYYVEMDYYMERFGRNRIQNLKFINKGFYQESLTDFLDWAIVYLPSPNNSHPFMNWTETPWGVK